MKQRHFMIFLLMILFPARYLSACDQCGCSVAGSFGGLMALNTENFAGFRFATYSFKNYVEHSSAVESHFYSMDLMGSFKINEKWQLFAYVPFKVIDYSNAEITHQSSGIGDAGFINTIALCSNSNDPMRKFSHRFSVKAGVELPTGHFNESFRQEQLPASVSEGTGSFDFLAGMQYTYQKKAFNFFADYTFKYHMVNQSNYTFGSQHSFSVIASERTDIKSMRILPYAGATAELIGSDKFYEIQQPGTKANILFANAGFELGIKKINIGLNCDLPVFSDFGSEDIHVQSRYSVRLNYSF